MDTPGPPASSNLLYEAYGRIEILLWNEFFGKFRGNVSLLRKVLLLTEETLVLDTVGRINVE